MSVILEGEFEDTLREFSKKLIEETIDIDPDIAKFIQENIMELFDDDNESV